MKRELLLHVQALCSGSSRRVCSKDSLTMRPGQMALTRTPSGPKSTAICRVSPSTPALSDEYLTPACTVTDRVKG